MLFADSSPYMVSTILGSCVSVCLWDASRGVGGMNHYLLPYWNNEGLQTPKYGNVAIPALIERMAALGSLRSGLVAKVFGGASVLENSSGLLSVGDRNITYAEGALEDEKIRVVSRDVGGVLGRKLFFKTSTGEVFLKKIQKTT
jgi:chemotaxis protein CheD